MAKVELVKEFVRFPDSLRSLGSLPIDVVPDQRPCLNPVSPQDQLDTDAQQPIPHDPRSPEHPRQRPDPVDAQSCPLKRPPIQVIGDQDPHETELQPSSLSTAEILPRAVSPDSIGQQLNELIDERQHDSQHGTVSSVPHRALWSLSLAISGR